MKSTVTFAFDRSARRIDVDGRLHVEKCNISKATVNPYYGREIPGYQSLGLDADTIYQIFRDPQELLKAVGTFNNIPLLSSHIPVNADNHQPDAVVGSTGTDCSFDGTYLTNSLVVWANDAIAGVETGQQRELSCAYRYTPVLEAGTFDGQPYTLKMTNIIGNHVALVERGRAGSDVLVSDQAINILPLPGVTKMTLEEIKAAMAADAALSASVKAIFAKDEEEEEKDDEKKPAEDEDETEGEEEKKEGVTEDAMNKAIAAAVALTTKNMNELHQARKDVQDIVGDVAMDSASEVYKFALDHLKIDVIGVHPTAYRALVTMAQKKSDTTQRLAMDAEVKTSLVTKFPGIARIKNRG